LTQISLYFHLLQLKVGRRWGRLFHGFSRIYEYDTSECVNISLTQPAKLTLRKIPWKQLSSDFTLLIAALRKMNKGAPDFN
jgi:hypothetical protein